ncbi:hypothetical protein HMPREF0620_0166 [Parascardovia denticolens DSM 10105 = JCM 12538]|uniref:Uncharacterized protein n=1 Tax=Parascardovia denticolens DSM 10105 = JCM 12538 TaxID=864564 RepID=E6JZE6_PARDN|nr:hypothetical protein HMPREF0620_0166 [Parascardovia denticolens DSM 10105 = JCM 12538]BAR05929.1 hypothetical protein PSDT_1410 [Parascardovia denticolens DSM 10105 = JCM 12538]
MISAPPTFLLRLRGEKETQDMTEGGIRPQRKIKDEKSPQALEILKLHS